MFYVRHHHRHSPHIFRATLQERSISARPCGWTKWDTDDGVSPMFYVRHHHRHSPHWSCEQRYRCAGAQHLGEALRVNQVRHWRWSFPDVLCPPSSQTLTTLYLSSNSIGAAGAQHLGEALRVNQVRHWRWSFPNVLCPPSSQTLTTLNLQRNDRCRRSAASRRGLAGEPSETLRWSFPNEPSSQTLTTQHAGAQHLGEALRVNQVRHWRWSFPNVLSLWWSQTLTTLELDGNSIGAAAAQHLREASRVNRVSCCERETRAYFLSLMITDGQDYRDLVLFLGWVTGWRSLKWVPDGVPWRLQCFN